MDQLHIIVNIIMIIMQIAHDVTSGSFQIYMYARRPLEKVPYTGLLNCLFCLYICNEKLKHVAQVSVKKADC